MSGPGVDSEVGVWVRTGSGLTLSVNPIAKALTVWPDAQTSALGLPSSEGDAVLECFTP